MTIATMTELSDLDTDALVQELEARGYQVVHRLDDESLEEEALAAYYALASNNQTKAIELCKQLIQGITGRIL